MIHQLRKKCEALQKARRKLEKEKHDAHYAISKLRRKIEKKQKKLSKERLLSEGKDLEIDLLREEINALEQGLKSSKEDSDGPSEDCQAIGSHSESCVEPANMCPSQDPGQATSKASNGVYKTEDIGSHGFETTADNFWNRSKTVSSIKSDPLQRTCDGMNFPPYRSFDHAGRNELLSIKSSTTHRTSRRTTESEAPIDSMESGSRMDNSSEDDTTSRRRLRARKKVNYDIRAPEHWSGYVDWGDDRIL